MAHIINPISLIVRHSDGREYKVVDFLVVNPPDEHSNEDRKWWNVTTTVAGGYENTNPKFRFDEKEKAQGFRECLNNLRKSCGEIKLSNGCTVDASEVDASLLKAPVMREVYVGKKVKRDFVVTIPLKDGRLLQGVVSNVRSVADTYFHKVRDALKVTEQIEQQKAVTAKEATNAGEASESDSKQAETTSAPSNNGSSMRHARTVIKRLIETDKKFHDRTPEELVKLTGCEVEDVGLALQQVAGLMPVQ